MIAFRTFIVLTLVSWVAFLFLDWVAGVEITPLAALAIGMVCGVWAGLWRRQ